MSSQKKNFKEKLLTLEEDITPDGSEDEDSQFGNENGQNSQNLQILIGKFQALENTQNVKNSQTHEKFDRTYYRQDIYQIAENHDQELKLDQGYYDILNSFEPPAGSKNQKKAK
jgi:hypothetical protein